MADTLTFAVPVEWSKTTAYEQNIIVFVGKRAYTSLKAVPTGIEITDTSYWAETGVPRGSDTTQLKADIETLKGNVSTLQSNLTTTNSNVTGNNNAITSIRKDMENLQAALDSKVSKFDIVAANAAAHNAIYRGKDITSMETSGELYVNIANGTFDDIYIGDYFTKSINGTNYALRIAAFNYYYNMGDTAFTKPHAVIIPDSIFGTAQMNSSNVVTGGYIGTKMRTETLQTWLSYLKTAFGSHLLTPRCWYDNKCDGSSYSDASWYDGPLELMTEEQVYGARQQGITNHSGFYYPSLDYGQFPLFALDHSRICNRFSWWLRSVASPVGFALVANSGYASSGGASNSLGVRPRFLIG